MRLIDADALIRKICGNECGSVCDEECENAACNFYDYIMDAPTIEPEVRHGHWENIPGMNNTVFCSECFAAANKELAMKYKGCPFCLARMDGGGENG